MKIKGHVINPFQIQSASIMSEEGSDGVRHLMEIKYANGTENVFYFSSREEALEELDAVDMIMERMLPRSSI